MFFSAINSFANFLIWTKSQNRRWVKAGFHFRVFQRHVYARKILNASEFLLSNVWVNEFVLKYAKN